jgi:hypothetical protein
MNQTVDPVKRYKEKMKAIADEKRCDKMIADYGVNTYQQFPNGRDFMCFKRSSESRESREKYRENFDRVFPNAPGAGM